MMKKIDKTKLIKGGGASEPKIPPPPIVVISNQGSEK